MKYIFRIIYLTVLMIIISIIFGCKALWDLKTDLLKDLWSEYRSSVAATMWKGFKINIY